MRVSFRQVDMESGEVQDIELVDPTAAKETPATSLIDQALAWEGKYDPVVWFLGPPSRPGERRPVAIQVFEDSIVHDD